MTPDRSARLRALTIAAQNAEQAWVDAREARDDAFEEADLDREPVRAIARHSGMSPAHVHRIIAGRTAARQDQLLTGTGIAA